MSTYIQFCAGGRVIHKGAGNICGRVQLGCAQGGSVGDGCRGIPGENGCRAGGHDQLNGLDRCLIVGRRHRFEGRLQCVGAFAQFCSSRRIISERPKNIRFGVQLRCAQSGSISDGCRSSPGDNGYGLGHNQLNRFCHRVVIGGISRVENCG